MKEEEKKKKSAKPVAMKSPKAANKQSKTEEAPAPPPPAESQPTESTETAAATPPAIVYDSRSNVYGVAFLPLVELFQSGVGVAAPVDVLSTVSAVLPPADVPLMAPDRRTNLYAGTLLCARLRLLYPLPPLSQLAAEVKYARAVAVWPAEDESSWLRVYGEIVRLNARAVGVEDGESEGQGSWQWLEEVKADERTQPAVDFAVEQKEEESKAEKDKDKSKLVKGKKDIKPSDVSAAAASTATSPQPPPRSTLQPPPRVLPADHITGAVVMDGRSRWLFLEGLADCDAWKAVEAVLAAERKSTSMRALVDGGLRFAERSFVGCPLSLLAVRLTSALSILQTKKVVASTSTCVLALSALSALLAPQLLPDLKASCRANGWLDGQSVQTLKEKVGRETKLEEMYGKERGKRERSIRKEKAREAKEKEEKEAAETEKKEQERQQQQTSADASGSESATQDQPQTPIQQKTVDVAAAAPVPTSQPTEAAAAQAQTSEDCPVVESMAATQEAAEATALAGTIVARKRSRRAAAAPHSAPAATLPTYTYSNAAEYQAALRSLRAACHADTKHHYTFHVDYLHSSVPACESIDEVDKEQRRQSKQKWRTDGGFVMPPSRVGQLFSQFGLLSEGERERERHERRRKKTVEELVDAAWHDKQQTYQQRREVKFYTQPLFPALFDKSPPQSVHLSGAQQLAAQRAQQQRDRQRFAERLCVDDASFHVLWGSGQNRVVGEGAGEEERRRVGGGCRLFGLRGLRKDEPVKEALKFEGQTDGHGQRKPTQKQLVVEDLPVSITNVGEWHDPSQLQFRASEKPDGQAEFIRYFNSHQFIHKPHIQP